MDNFKDLMLLIIDSYNENLDDIYSYFGDYIEEKQYNKVLNFDLTDYIDDDIYKIELNILEINNDYNFSYETYKIFRDFKEDKEILLDFFKNYVNDNIFDEIIKAIEKNKMINDNLRSIIFDNFERLKNDK